jgi:hypothetical protein
MGRLRFLDSVDASSASIVSSTGSAVSRAVLDAMPDLRYLATPPPPPLLLSSRLAGRPNQVVVSL